MAIIMCKMCGGDLILTEGSTVAECENCGTHQTVPTADNEKMLTLFSRANRLRAACEFDKAAGIYETIVAEFPKEAEAYWGLVLCKYGIEYVDDPGTGKKIPTCHRSSFDSVLKDENYSSAISCADVVAREVYQKEAQQIEALRKDIVMVSSGEAPYDVFICYKETGSDNKRTLDSVLAQDIYDALTDKGYRVFFARISLEDKLGQAYEPYIFAALHSAKIMLAVGTKFEHFQAVWVKNEWSRFLKLMTADKNKHLIPCYKGIDAYDMPEEFARLQAQDLDKMGAIQDILRGVEKLLPKKVETVKESVKETVKEVVVQGGNASTASLLERAKMFLEDGDWSNAAKYCEKVLDIDPKNAQAYAYKLTAKHQYRKIEMLKNAPSPLDKEADYQKVLRFGDDGLKKILEQCNAEINARILQEKYREAVKLLANATQIEQFRSVKAMFEALGGYQDCAAKIEVCNEKIQLLQKEAYYKKAKDLEDIGQENQLREAITMFEQLGDFKDSRKQVELCRKAIAKIEAEREQAYLAACKAQEEIKTSDNAFRARDMFYALREYKDSKDRYAQCEKERERLRTAELLAKSAAERAARNKKKIIVLISIAAVFAMIVAAAILIPYFDRQEKIENAETLLAEGEYDKAVEAFEALGLTEDVARVKLQEARDIVAKKESSIYTFEAGWLYKELIRDYGMTELEEEMRAMYYNAGTEEMKDGYYISAASEFQNAGNYQDSAEKVKECHYLQGKKYIEESKIDEAVSEFRSADDYQDAATLLNYSLARQTANISLLDAEQYLLQLPTDLYDVGDMLNVLNLYRDRLGSYTCTKFSSNDNNSQYYNTATVLIQYEKYLGYQKEAPEYNFYVVLGRITQSPDTFTPDGSDISFSTRVGDLDFWKEISLTGIQLKVVDYDGADIDTYIFTKDQES